MTGSHSGISYRNHSGMPRLLTCWERDPLPPNSTGTASAGPPWTRQPLGACWCRYIMEKIHVSLALFTICDVIQCRYHQFRLSMLSSSSSGSSPATSISCGLYVEQHAITTVLSERGFEGSAELSCG